MEKYRTDPSKAICVRLAMGVITLIMLGILKFERFCRLYGNNREVIA